MTAIELREVTVARRGRALSGVNLRVERGETVAFLSDDQEAVTSLIRAVGGLLLPDSGQILVGELDVAAASRREMSDLRRTMGYVLAEGGAFSNMSLRENVAVVLRYHTESDEAEIQRRAERLLALLGLTAEADLRASTVVPALQKRTAYARALVHDPSVLLSEDPSALLDPEGRRAVALVHEELHGRGVTTLIADDDLPYARLLAQRAVVFTEQRITFDGPIGEIPPALARRLEQVDG